MDRKAGYLKKESLHLRIRRKRWIVLKDEYLYCYKNETCNKLTEKFDLNEFNTLHHQNNTNRFAIANNSILITGRIFVAINVKIRNQWIKCIQNAINRTTQSKSNKSIHGINIKEKMKTKQSAFNIQYNKGLENFDQDTVQFFNGFYKKHSKIMETYLSANTFYDIRFWNQLQLLLEGINIMCDNRNQTWKHSCQLIITSLLSKKANYPRLTVLNDFIESVMHFRAKLFVQASYFDTIYVIYDNYNTLNKAFMEINTMVNGKQIPIKLESIYCEYMKDNTCYEFYKWIVINGFIRINNNMNSDISQCVIQIIGTYYMCNLGSFNQRVDYLIKSEIDLMDLTTFEDVINRIILINECFSMINIYNGKRFYQLYRTNIQKCIVYCFKIWDDKYVSKELNIMEYTDEMEKCIVKTHDINGLDKICEDSIGMCYVATVSSLNKMDNYNQLVSNLNKNELVRIYKLFCMNNLVEAKRLNESYEHLGT